MMPASRTTRLWLVFGGIALLAVAGAFAAVILTSQGGRFEAELAHVCGEARERDSTGPSLFPDDMSGWTCQQYLQCMRHAGTYEKLQQLLQIRPYRFFEEANKDQLRTLSINYLPNDRAHIPYTYCKVHKSVYDSLVQLLEAAQKDGYDLRVRSAFRGAYYQNALWKTALQKRNGDLEAAAFEVAPPCYSEHATGKSVDFALPTLEGKIADSPVYQWLLRNGGNYGWKPSLIEGNGITTSEQKTSGIGIEEWHFRHSSLNK